MLQKALLATEGKAAEDAATCSRRAATVTFMNYLYIHYQYNNIILISCPRMLAPSPNGGDVWPSLQASAMGATAAEEEGWNAGPADVVEHVGHQDHL